MAKKSDTTTEATTLPLEAEVTATDPETPAAEETTVAAEPETPAADPDKDETGADDQQVEEPEPEEPVLIEPTPEEIEAAKKADLRAVRLGFLEILEAPMTEAGRARLLVDLGEYNSAQIRNGVFSLAGIGVALNIDDLAKTFADWCYSARIRVMAEA